MALHTAERTMGWSTHANLLLHAHKKEIVVSVGSGVLTLAEAFLHQKLLNNDKGFDPKFTHLIDMTGIQRFEVKAEEARRLARKEPFSALSRLALLAVTPLMLKTAERVRRLIVGKGAPGDKRFSAGRRP